MEDDSALRLKGEKENVECLYGLFLSKGIEIGWSSLTQVRKRSRSANAGKISTQPRTIATS